MNFVPRKGGGGLRRGDFPEDWAKEPGSLMSKGEERVVKWEDPGKKSLRGIRSDGGGGREIRQ